MYRTTRKAAAELRRLAAVEEENSNLLAANKYTADLLNQALEELAALKAAMGEPVHFRALLDPEQLPQQLKTSMHVVGFRTRKSADEFVASELDTKGWRYVIEPLFTIQKDKP